MYFLKIKQLSVSRGAGFKSITLLISYPLSVSIIFVLKITNLAQGTRKLIVKLYSSRLNTRPYNKLLKELKDC